ncbi:dTMP kinase [Aliifodinibius sp. S!AR15-10]|uniref:dTMP kinase n=1 Tax=Aliifodinibius sp. S!AR15-10 TaxID=2950437 RepID=UPI00285A6713|nr:dTMP kinase [Aliifodinibius sp. S!AR15-10]MDR8392352.1 dTMP kinase [Aliifodinibius sp. S!AR15-10]
MFITFEGIDGSGKSTHIDLLREKLEEEGYHVEVFREPGGTELSEKIRSLLLDSQLDIDPVSELLLFSAARAQLISERVIPLLEEGAVVILDRFYDSTTAYQGYGRSSASLDAIAELNELASHHREPDLTFYLQISLEESKNRTAKLPKDRMEQSGDKFFRKVIEGFEKLASSENRIIAIDASLSLEQVQELIWNRTEQALNQS